MGRIWLSPPHVGEGERALLLEAFDSNWIAPAGPHLERFEEKLASLARRQSAAALSSGTAALHLGLKLLGVGPGSEVLMPTLTFVATAAAATYLGGRPVFVDSDPHTWTIDPGLLEEELGRRARRGRLPAAVVSVDLYGQCADYERVEQACARFGVPLLEDAAEALGSSYRGRPAGSFGQLSVFSFNGNKIVTSGGGGSLLGDDASAIARARHLACQARQPVAHFEHEEVGYNYRLSNLLAAVGLAQLDGLADKVARRRHLNRRYRQALGGLAGVSFMPEAAYGVPNCWLTCMLVDPVAAGVDREALRRLLEDHAVESRPAWKPLHLQPAFAGAEVVGGAVAEGVFERGLCLPSGSSLTTAEQDRVIELLHQGLGGTGASG
jgi:dTDP-4-amino-4,6-dideoxygalactose transaminase